MPDLTIEAMRMCCSNERFKAFVGRYLVEFREIYGPHRKARMCTHDWVCSCQQFQHRLKYEDGAYCKHIKQAQQHHCGWHQQGWGDGPQLTEDTEDVRVVGRTKTDEDPCPLCGGPTRVVQVAV